MDSTVILAIVFISVLMLALAIIPAIQSNAQADRREHGNGEAFLGGGRHLLHSDNCLQVSYTLALIVGACGLAVIIATRFYLGFVAVVFLATMAYMAPGWMLKRRIAQRDNEVDAGLLDFTLLVVNALRSGTSLPSALELACKNTGGVVGDAFGSVLREHSLGLDLGDAIERLAGQINSENLQLFSATVCVSMRTGGSMADVLDQVVDTIRQRAAVAEKLRTLTARTRFEVVLMSVSPLFAFIILYCIDENLMMPLVTTQLGWFTICGILVWQTLGFFVLKHVTKIRF